MSLTAGSGGGAVDLSVVIPVYNEEKRIVDTITRLSGYLSQQGHAGEVIISDDGSHDSGPALVKERFAGDPLVRMTRAERNQGKGAAVRRGVMAARGELIIFTDADLSYPVETIGRCLQALDACDVVAGSRNLPQSQIAIEPPLLRRLTGMAFKTAVRGLVLTGFSDTQCGFKGFRREAAREIFSRCTVDGFAFDVEVLALARLMGFRVSELPVLLALDSSDSSINLTTDPLRMAGDLLRIRRQLGRLKRSGAGKA